MMEAEGGLNQNSGSSKIDGVNQTITDDNIRIKGNRMINLEKDAKSKQNKELRNIEISSRTSTSEKNSSTEDCSDNNIQDHVNTEFIKRKGDVEQLQTSTDANVEKDLYSSKAINDKSHTDLNSGHIAALTQNADEDPYIDSMVNNGCDPHSKNVSNDTAEEELSVRSKIIHRGETDLKTRRADVRSMDVDEEKGDVKTPVYEDMDPAQAILSQHRLAAYLASPDCPPAGDAFAAAAAASTPTTAAAATTAATATNPAVTSRTLSVGLCDAELAEAALEAVGGTVTRLPNNAVAFVADDINRKIRLASPNSAGPSYPGSGASTPRFLLNHPSLSSIPMHGVAHHQSNQPLDPQLLNDIERHARKLATNVDTLIENLTDALHGISALTVDYVETYRDTVCKTCDAVDANIKSMYQLMAKGEELSKSMKPVYAMHAQIKDVRRTVDILDSEMHAPSS